MSIVILDLVDSHFCLNQVNLSCCLMTEPILSSFSVYSNVSFVHSRNNFSFKVVFGEHSNRCPLRSLKVLPTIFWPYLIHNNLLLTYLLKNASLKEKKTSLSPYSKILPYLSLNHLILCPLFESILIVS